MIFYCKKQPIGKWLKIPDDWKIKNLHYEKGFISIEELYGHQDEKLPYFITIEPIEQIKSLTDLCHELSKYITEQQANFWLLYYYALSNICLLASEKNYFSKSNYEVIELGA